LVTMCALGILLVQPREQAYSNPEPQKKTTPNPPNPEPQQKKTPKPPTPPVNPKPKPNRTTPVPSATRSSASPKTVPPPTAVSVMQTQHFSGTAPRSLTWQSRHLHYRWLYQVRFRSPLWSNRVFDSELAALTFMGYLRYHGFQEFLSNPSDDTWVVTYWSLHWRTFGTYASLPVAREVEAALVFDGFPAWVVWRPIYSYW